MVGYKKTNSKQLQPAEATTYVINTTIHLIIIMIILTIVTK